MMTPAMRAVFVRQVWAYARPAKDLPRALSFAQTAEGDLLPMSYARPDKGSPRTVSYARTATGYRRAWSFAQPATGFLRNSSYVRRP